MALTRPRYSQIPDSDYKNSCRIVTTTNVTLTGSAPLTYDGVTLIQYDRVLVAGQTDKTQNGIYSVTTLGTGSNGSWVRSKDANANDRLTAGMNTFVEEGTYTGQFWHLLTPGPIVLGVTELIFGQISGNAAGTSSQVQYNLNGSIAGAANLRYDYDTGNVLIGNGRVSTSSTTGALVVKGGAGISGNVNVGGNVTADKFYTTNGLFWSGNGLAFSSGLEVSEINAANALSNISSQVTSIRFDKDTGFSVSELNPGNIKVSLGSSFKTWHVPGQADLVAAAEDEVTFFGNGIDITTNPTFPKAITFISNNSILEANIGAFYNYANANIGTLFLGNASTQANIGEFYNYANANIGTLFLGNASTQANIGEFYNYANANIGTLFLGNASTQANIGAFYNYANANIGSIYNNLNTLDANVGAFETYANIYLSTAATFTVTNAGAGAYVINGESNPALYLIRGQKYNFSVGAAGHPFWIKTAASTGTGDQYNTGVVNNGDDVGLITFDVPLTAPDVLYYICQYHSSMVGQLRIVNFAEIDANIGTLFLGNASTQANIGTIKNNLSTLDANVGAYQLYANANVGSIYNQVNTLDANVGAYQLYANANIGTLYLGNISTQANLGAFQAYANSTFATGGSTSDLSANLGAYQLYANANIGSIYNQLNTLDANVGAFEVYANANIGTLYLGNISTNANLGAYQTWANLEISGAYSEIDALYIYVDSNAAIQTSNLGNIVANLNSITANIGAFELYANSKIGNNSNSNLVVRSTTESVSAITGALVVAGGAGIGGNLYVAGNIYASNLTAISISTLSVTDPLLYLTASNPFPYNYDIGFFSHYSKVSGDERHTGLARDYTTDIWNFFSNIDANPGATVNWAEANIIYDTVRLGDLIVSNTTQSTSTTTGALRVAGGAGIVGNLYITNTGDVSANIGNLYLGNIALNANLGAFQTYANNTISNISVDLSNYEEINSANVGLIYNQLNTLDANVGTLFLGNASTNANLGAYQLYANANIGSIYNQLNTLDANVGAFELYANANIGTLFLSNASTSANLGAFQIYANTTFTTYSNANVTAYLPTHTGNIGANGITSSGNINVYAGVNKGSYASGVDFTSGDIKITDDTLGSAYLIFLNAPSFSNITSLVQIGDTVTIDYGSPQTTTIAGNLEVVPNDPYIGSYPNSLGFRLTDNFGITGQPDNDVDNLTIPTYKNWQFRSNGWLSAPATIAASNIVVASDTTTNKIYVNEGLFWSGNGFSIINTGGGGSGTPGGTNTQIQYNDGGAFNGANITFNKSNGNVIISSVSNSSSKTTGALVVRGGVGVAGNVTADKFYTTSGLFWSANNERVTTRYTASTSAPTVPLVGDHWYNTSTDVLYEYVLDGTTSYWVDIITPAISTLSTPVVTYIGETFAGNLIIAGNITGSLGFLLEKTNIAPISPPTITDIDVLTCPITFFVSNATSNITANLRGNATTPLNDVVANGQSATFSIFFPQATPYYVNQVYIDNILIDNVAWQGTVPVTSGNANSVDLYTFTAIKGSVNNWRVFASQTNYTHSGEWSDYREMIFAVEYLLVAGGGSGATSYGGGGGGGGVTNGNINITQGRTYTITVGAGGAAVTTTNTLGVKGGNSQISGTGLTTVSATGGGFGARQNSVGGDGGSGGGGGGRTSGSGALAGGASSPVTSPVQGYAGGAGFAPVSGARGAGGGGGAGAVGTAGTGIAGGDGGVGTNTYSVWTTATSTGAGGRLAGGGGGGTVNALYPGGAGGTGGGGAGNAGSNNSATAGTPNTGGGGGGMGDITTSASSGAGGSGLVILRYPITSPPPFATSGSPTLTTSGGYRYYVWTGDGTITF